MSKKSKQHDKQFKQNAVQYVKEHPDLSLEECAKEIKKAEAFLQKFAESTCENCGGSIEAVWRDGVISFFCQLY